jgi:protein ImuB
VVTLDISGLETLIGDGRTIGEEMRRSAADAGLRVHIAVAATTTAAILLAHARAGLTVVARGAEAATLAPLPLRTLSGLWLLAAGSRPEAGSRTPVPEPVIDQLTRWGLRTLGDLAALPPGELAARLGHEGVRWQRWARGDEERPLVPGGVVETFEESLDLEWPIEGLEPLSFVLARLFEPLCGRLEKQDRGAVTLHLTMTLVTRERHVRLVELPAPIRDARVLRTLALLDLESNPPPAAIDRVTIGVDVTEGRVLQFGLFARVLPTDTLATLMARLGALMGSDRVGAPALVDTYRPGAFAMAKFEPSESPIPNPQPLTPNPQPLIPRIQTSVLRRFRSPIPARVTVEQGRPARVTTDRRGFGGGRVERCEGPWRSSGDWWKQGWNCDEWDVMLGDGTAYRISQALDDRQAWFVDGLLD